MSMNENEECLYPGCRCWPSARGLCMSHYNSAAHLVRSRRTTWEEMEERKAVLPRKGKGGRRIEIEKYFLG